MTIQQEWKLPRHSQGVTGILDTPPTGKPAVNQSLAYYHIDQFTRTTGPMSLPIRTLVDNVPSPQTLKLRPPSSEFDGYYRYEGKDPEQGSDYLVS